ncbi:immunity 8 family protein [Amycolatopsis sp. NPDC049252]|uniref:immunity 8 family protein n=1 Tax=Amycolatopsis sp. NPDC049252 TaxID=3363933 RepID=UPI003714126E
MRAEIRFLLTPDIEPESYVPEDPERFMFLVQMIAGPAGEPGEESFCFEVCTPGWLRDEALRDGPISGRHHVIVDRFDWPSLLKYFDGLVASCEGADWTEVTGKLSRYGLWEFEDYRPSS